LLSLLRESLRCDHGVFSSESLGSDLCADFSLVLTWEKRHFPVLSSVKEKQSILAEVLD
jgi:hypothetical protein